MELGLWIALVVIVLCVLPIVVLIARRRWLTSQGGVFDCAHQNPGGPWELGFARYLDDRLQWFPSLSFGLAPSIQLSRAGTAHESQRPAAASAATGLFSSPREVLVRDRATGREHLFTMEADSVTALMSWLESSPPGQTLASRHGRER